MEKATTIHNSNANDTAVEAQTPSVEVSGGAATKTASSKVRDTLRAVVDRSIDKKRQYSRQAEAASAETSQDKDSAHQTQIIERLRTTLDLVAVSLEHGGFQDTTDALAAELASQLGAERVSIGFVRRDRIRLRSFSNKARFSHRTDVVRDIETAMQECIDQSDTLIYPLPDDRPPHVTWAHARLSRRQEAGGALSVPLSVDDEVTGAITAECPSGEVFSAERIELLETLAALLSPLLENKRRTDHTWLERLYNGVPGFFRKLVGPENLVRKFVSLLVIALLLFVSLTQGEFRLSARAELEGAIQRTLVSPISGYIATAAVRPGDRVSANQLLASLEDSDLRLESTKLEGRRHQLQREYRAAVAGHDRSKIAILNAQMGQIQAELDRADALLARTKLIAPFDGVVVSGDLSQALGAPVERGQVLLEIAPLDAYRVVLEADERDLEYIREGQAGNLVLSSHPDTHYPIVVESITPVASTGEGRTFFRVEAWMDQATPNLRPHMDGVAKLDAGERSLLWIWSRRLIDTVSLWLWTHW